MSKTVRATVRLVIEIEDDSTWGADCTLDQVSKQAEQGVISLMTSGNIEALRTLPRRLRSVKTISVRVYDSEMEKQ